MLHLKLSEEVTINDVATEEDVANHYDCFDKWDKFKYQKEWRICLNRNNYSKESYRLEIGSISDIAFVVHVNNLLPALSMRLSRMEETNPLIFLPSYDGTVSRDDFKNNVYKLRPNKGHLIVTIM